MKTRFYVLLLGLCACFVLNLNAQTCVGNFSLTTQQEINDWAANNNNCKVIDGNLTISGFNIVSLDGTGINIPGLSEITEVKGNLIISGTNLLTLNGLDDLMKVEGNLFIQLNPLLESMEGLGSFETLDGKFLVESNNSLASFQGIDNLVSFGNSIEIVFNPALTSLAGVNYPKVMPPLQIAFNDNITDLSPLMGIDTIKGEVEIQEMPRLQNLEGFNNVKVITGNLFLNNNDSLTNLTGFDSLLTIGNNMIIRNNLRLTNLDGLDTLGSVMGRVEIENNDSLLNLQGLNELRHVGDDFKILDNPSLLSCAGVDKLEHIGGSLEVINNDTLFTFGGFTMLDSIVGNLEVEDNLNLDNINGFNALNFAGLVKINNNDSLTSITAFANLLVIQNTLSINDNPFLESLRGLNKIDENEVNIVTIKNNIRLFECQTAAICAIVSGFPGKMQIEDNLPGCNTVEEIEILCQTSPLPVELLYFTGELVDGVSYLRWSTASEYNNEGFAVERSPNGAEWTEIGFVRGQGNTSQINNYQFVDRQPITGENYYRLRQLDYNGTFNFSEVVVLRLASGKLELEAYPNPSDNIVTVQIDNPGELDMTLMIHDYTGRTIFQSALSAQSNWSQDFKFETKGMYFISLQAGQQWHRKKVIYTGGE